MWTFTVEREDGMLTGGGGFAVVGMVFFGYQSEKKQGSKIGRLEEKIKYEFGENSSRRVTRMNMDR